MWTSVGSIDIGAVSNGDSSEFQRGSRLVLSIHIDRGSLSTSHELASQPHHQVSTAGLQSSSLMSALKKTAAQQSKRRAFDDEFVKPIRGW